MVKKYGISLLISVIMALIFTFAASMEYRHSVEQEQDSLREDLVNIQTNIENMISSRIINANVFAGLIELDKMIDKENFDVLAAKVYDYESHVVKDIVFITDTTISYVYPARLAEGSIGIDLNTMPEQKELLNYTKDENKTIFLGPLDLVEGGQGIVVRVPVAIDGEYYGQVGIVFDYNNFIEESGLKDSAQKNKIFLEGNNPISKEIASIWTNGYEESENYVAVKLYMHDIEWWVKGKPIKGWSGDSLLFYIIIIVGIMLTIVAGMVCQKEYNLKVKLKKANEGLEEKIYQLAENKKELLEKYNVIRQKENYIQNLADHDELTGLYNRRIFRQHLKTAINEGKQGIVILIDIDDFKNINDIHGHLYGDELLKIFAKSMVDAFRNDCKIYRFGGDEFLILVESDFDDITISEYTKSIKDKLVNAIINSIPSPITLSSGVVKYPEQGQDVESLLIRADIAMYKSKDSGKNKLTIFKEALLQSLDYKIRIETHLRQAILNNEFSMYYQPIIDALTGEIVSFEALIRLNDYSYTPVEFIEVAEATGLIVPLGEWILEEVFSRVSSWQAKGLNPKPVAINLSPRQLVEPSFRNMFFDKIKKANIPMELIEIEITENVFLENEEANIAILREFRSCGIKVSMDDFGTGYSSLSYLTYLPIDKVKIDKSLKDQLIQLDDFLPFSNNFSSIRTSFLVSIEKLLLSVLFFIL